MYYILCTLHFKLLNVSVIFNRTAYAGNETPFALQVGMFPQVLSSQSTEEQTKRWLPKVMSHEMIGTYAQTEMGHGKSM